MKQESLICRMCCSGKPNLAAPTTDGPQASSKYFPAASFAPGSDTTQPSRRIIGRWCNFATTRKGENVTPSTSNYLLVSHNVRVKKHALAKTALGTATTSGRSPSIETPPDKKLLII
jgi:hypothetical protein